VANTLTFELFCQQYSNEEACIQALFFSRWPDGFCCPRCAHRQFYIIRTRKLPLYECRLCHAQTSLIAGTIMEGSRTPLKSWFQALFLHSEPEGLSATRLASIIGTTYKTAWLICHKIRHAMTNAESNSLLSGLVRINWGVYGRPFNPTIFRHHQEHPLLAGATIGSDDRMTHLKLKQIPDEQLINDRITPSGSRAFTSQYVDPTATEVIIVTLKFSRHRFRPLIQICVRASQWINDTFQGIGAKHLQSYLDQFCYSFNIAQSNDNFFETLLYHSATTRTIKYPALISRKNHSSQHKNIYIEHLRNAS
jgi:hypothetical protein